MTPESKRKISHWFILLIPFSYIFLFSKEKTLLILGMVALIIMVFEFFRLKDEKLNKKILKMFAGVYRKDEVKHTSTLIYTISGIFFTIFFFRKDIALLAIFFLTFGDGFCAIIGEKYGKHKIIAKKSWEGAISNLLICLTVGFIFSNFYKMSYSQIILGSVAAAVVELLPVRDNLVIPVFSALIMTLV